MRQQNDLCMHPFKNKHIVLVVIVAVIASCNIMKPYKPPVITEPDLYRGVSTRDTNTIATLHWKEIFTDTLLQELITMGIRHNLDLKIAMSRIRQASAAYKQSRLALYPSVNADAAATLAGASNSANTGRSVPSQQYSAEITANWEADIWGKLRSTRDANLALMLQADANARAVQTMLVPI